MTALEALAAFDDEPPTCAAGRTLGAVCVAGAVVTSAVLVWAVTGAAAHAVRVLGSRRGG